MDLGLKGQTILSIGGTSNLGKGASIELTREGANVVAVYMSNDEKARKTKELICGEGGSFEVFKGDMSDEDAVDAAFRFAIEKFGRVDGLICGPMYHEPCPLVDVSLERWRRAMDVNLTSVFLANRWAVRYWLENNMPGRILNFTSVNAFQGDHTPRAYYAASKAAVIGFTKSVSHEVGSKGILANCIAPGFSVERELPQEYIDTYTARIPMKKIGKPADLAKMIAYLVSPANTYMLGATVDVSGGMIMH